MLSNSSSTGGKLRVVSAKEILEIRGSDITTAGPG